MRILAIGHRCSTSTLLQQLGERTESYPFDWCVTNIDTVRHCIEDDFRAFLCPDHYEIFTNETYNLRRGQKCHLIHETVCCNRFYEQAKPNEESTYRLKLALTHKRMDIPEDVEYAQRCVSRFRQAMASIDLQYMLHIYPIMDHPCYESKRKDILEHSFRPFCQMLHTKYPSASVYTIFVFVVFHEECAGQLETFYEDKDMVVLVLYVPDDMADIGAFFEGQGGDYMATILRERVRDILNKR